MQVSYKLPQPHSQSRSQGTPVHHDQRNRRFRNRQTGGLPHRWRFAATLAGRICWRAWCISFNISELDRLNKEPPPWSNRLMKNAGSKLMKNMKWVGLVASLAFPLLSGYAQTPGAPVPGAPEQAQAAVGANLSPGAAEVVRLAGSGVGDDVVLAYIRNSQAPFSLSADNVLYLKDVGLSAQVTSAMLSHDSTLRGQPQQYAPMATAPAARACPVLRLPQRQRRRRQPPLRPPAYVRQSAGGRKLFLQRSFALWRLGVTWRVTAGAGSRARS